VCNSGHIAQSEACLGAMGASRCSGLVIRLVRHCLAVSCAYFCSYFKNFDWHQHSSAVRVSVRLDAHTTRHVNRTECTFRELASFLSLDVVMCLGVLGAGVTGLGMIRAQDGARAVDYGRDEASGDLDAP